MVACEPPTTPERRPRIGYVLKKYPRLSETFILNEILGVEEQCADVTIFSLLMPDDGRFHSDLAKVKAPVDYVPAFGSRSTLAAFTALDSMLREKPAALKEALEYLDLFPEERRVGLLIQSLHVARRAVELGLDHLHAHFMTIASHVVCLVNILTGIPYSVTAHAKDIYRETVDRRIFARTARSARRIVTVTDFNRRHIEDNLVDPGAENIARIYNGLPLDAFSASDEPRRTNLVLGVGRLVEKKGFHVLLDAMRRLIDRGIDVECVLVGDGEAMDLLREKTKALGLDGAVRFTGALPREEVVRWMSRARILAAPCLTAADGNRDALPTVIIEAVALGLPVVATRLNGIPEIIDDGIHGSIIPENDVDALVSALERLLADDVTWRRMSDVGPERARERFDRNVTIPQLAEAMFGGVQAAVT